MKKKVVYLGLAVDLIHPGHLNIINEAKKYGEVVVLLNSDKWLREKTRGRAWVISVEARENDKNSSIYTNPDAGFKGWTS